MTAPAVSTAQAAADRRFTGVARLYGDEAARAIRAAHVCVIGIGGVGSWAAEALARSGVGALTLVDLDHVAESNVNRQVHALSSTLGAAKVKVMRERIAEISPACSVEAVEEFLDEDNAAFFAQAPFDAIVDAIDQVRAKAALAQQCRRAKRHLVVCGGAGGKTDPTRIRVSDISAATHDPLLAKLRATLRRERGFPREGSMRLASVWSDEPMRRPQACEADLDPSAGLACAGYGSIVTVTATMGFAAAARALDFVARGAARARHEPAATRPAHRETRAASAHHDAGETR